MEVELKLLTKKMEFMTDNGNEIQMTFGGNRI